jgi:hypothetical protein
MGTLIDAELECGNVQAAIELGERVLAQMAGSRDEWSRMLVRSNLALGWLAVDNTVRGRELMQAVWPPALQSRLHVLCSDNLALLCALERRPRTAARLLGYADAAYGARGIVRHPVEGATRERAAVITRSALGDRVFEQLYGEGRMLRDAQIEALAFAPEDAS